MLTRKIVTLATASALALSLFGCATPSKQQVGIGTGAVVGGVAGHALTGGSTAGTVGGAAVGGLIGNEVTKPK